MDFGQPQAVWLAALAVLLAVVAVGLAATSLAGQRRVRRAYRAFSRGGPGRPRDDVLTLLHGHIDEVSALRAEVAKLDRRADQIRDLLRGSVSRVATVHYDAFDEMGGQLSFSTALLDEHGDGVVVSSINGRTETRTYAKQLTAGSSNHNLSTEEREAIDRARGLADRTGTPPGGRGTSGGSGGTGGSGGGPPRGQARPGPRPRRRRFLTRT